MKQKTVLTFAGLLSLLFTPALNPNNATVQAQSRDLTVSAKEAKHLTMQKEPPVDLLSSKRSVAQKPSAQLTAWTEWFEARTTREEKIESISRLSGDLSNEAWSKLVEIATGDHDMAVRKTAISYLAGRADNRAVHELIRLYDKENISEMRMELLSYLSGLVTPESRAKIRQIAKSDRDAKIRGKALDYVLGR
jgi:hypothetical protein